ncbi:hypothetical protein QAD02_023428 [Eretmocerus hayati]|uniref:Uncharacterized protein n=1 Tax=Eretmocerus hayati TaxID=131215 RepID=A0ACC2PYA4_9HYME|nr:hypothetical protein QAD02_023428 [Eretmocerus hayati]
MEIFFYPTVPECHKISVKIFYNTTAQLNQGKVHGRTRMLVENLSELLMIETLSDFTVKAETRDFRVHHCLLSALSPVLSRMLQCDMREKNENEVSLPCEDPVVLRELLNYIYTGDCAIAKVPHELFKIAHFLQISELCDMCNNFLLQNITIKNIIETLKLCDEEQYELNYLGKKAKEFVKSNEKTLVLDIEFENYLRLSITISNIAFILKIAIDYDLIKVYHSAMELIKQESTEVLQNADFQKLLVSNPKLSVSILEHILIKMQKSDDPVRLDEEKTILLLVISLM